jgi:CRISPR/Cas system-associated protein Cas10 (large subunit of type III CRISPR-Cas system)
MEKCGVCGMSLDRKPMIDREGKCDVCNKKLQTEDKEQRK